VWGVWEEWGEREVWGVWGEREEREVWECGGASFEGLHPDPAFTFGEGSVRRRMGHATQEVACREHTESGVEGVDIVNQEFGAIRCVHLLADRLQQLFPDGAIGGCFVA
jgi:hypothetical protein